MSEALSRVLDLRARHEYAEARELARTAAEDDAEPALLIELGRLEEERGSYDASATAFEQALSGADGERRARAAAGLVRARRAQGRLQEAQEIATAELRKAPQDQALLIAAGDVAAELDDLPLAQKHLEAAVEASANDAQLAKALGALGNLRVLQGLLEDAERTLRAALEVTEKATGPMSIELSLALNNLGALLKLTGNFDEARRLFERSLSLVELALGDDAAAAILHHNLARVLRAQRDFKGGLPHARRALELHAAALGPDHLETTLDRATLAAVLDGLGELAEAEALLGEAVTVLEDELGPEHPELSIHLNNLAAIAARRGDSAGAEALYRRSLAIKESSLGPESPALAATLNNLGLLLKGTGRVDEARGLLERAVRSLEGTADSGHPALQSAQTNLAALTGEPAQ